MKVALHTAVYFTGFISVAFEKVNNGLVNGFAIRAGFYTFKGLFLALLDCVIHVLQFGGRLAFDNRTGDVCEVTRAVASREYVDDDGVMGQKRSGAFIVWVTGLVATRDNGVGGAAFSFE